MIVTSKGSFKAVGKHSFAFLTPNYADQVSASAHIVVAERLRLPMILALAEVHQTCLPFDEVMAADRFYAEKARVPAVLYLDRGQTKETIFRAIDQGLRSVMIDASSQPLEKNVRQTKEIVACAHLRGVMMEAEVGHVDGGGEYKDTANCDSICTTAEEVKRLADLTEADSLAISIGTAHGTYKGTPVIDFKCLAKIRNVVRTLLVFHNGSSSGDEDLRRYAEGRISRINIYMDLIVTVLNRTKKCHTNGHYDLRDTQRQGMMEYLEHHYSMFDIEHYLKTLK